MQRLLDFVKDQGIVGPSALASALNESEQVISNWGARGISNAGAIAAEKRFGCSAVWLVQGVNRSDNLKRTGLTASELSNRVGGQKSYWHGMLTGQRPFGEKVARKIEAALDLQKGLMDENGPTTSVVSNQYKPSPYGLELARMFDNLPDDDVIKAAAFVAATEVMREAGTQKNNQSKSMVEK
jgi:hypothetical protein